ncbi:MAG: HTH-type transcriptional repressor YtrA [Smithella sp. PtaU1.Bin162]|nr:MAG: HTH-type transcriptional repressor YtrA [Smithella sp. PtaU1.Bin162]
MKILIQKKSHISLREQIKRQILILIENQELMSGQALPSARDLSKLINVNRNTITQAYKELESDGILEIIIGSGTYVKQGLIMKSKRKLDQIFNDAIQQSIELGFKKAEVMEHFLSRLSTLPASIMNKRILIVDCNDGVINYLCQKILQECGVKATGVLIQELEKDPIGAESLVKSIDLIVCGFNHLKELQQVLPDNTVEIIAVLIQVDVRVINVLNQLPKGTKIGCVCENQRSTNTLYNSSYFSGGRELKRILAGYDNSKELKKLIRECDVIFVTNFMFDRVKKLTTSDQRLVSVDISVDSSSLELIKEKICA